MSDRHGSVRTGSLVGDPAAPQDAVSEGPTPASATQSIPTTGSQRAQAPGGSPSGAEDQGKPAGQPSSPTTAPGSGPTPPGTPAPGATPPGVPAAGTTSAAGSTTAGSSGSTATTATSDKADASAPNVARTKGRGPVKAGGRGPRRARLQLRHIDTWSALKISLVLSIALFFIWMVAVGVLYLVLSSLGVFTTLNDLFGQLGSASGSKADGDVVTPGVVFGGAAVIGAINVVLLTALCTVGTFIYNLCSDLVGGLELTLSERD